MAAFFCSRHNVYHPGQCSGCIAEQTSQLGQLAEQNRLATQQTNMGLADMGTSIRRAGESEKHLLADHGFHAAFKKAVQRGTEEHKESINRRLAAELPEVLGHDRNGREVRRGDRVRCFDSDFELVAEAMSPEAPQYEACFHGHGRHILQQAAELVTDEKAERMQCRVCGAMPGSEHQKECSAYWFGSTAAPRNQNERHMPAHDGLVAAAIESLCRALAQPTMEQQYNLFRMQMELAVRDITNGVGSVVCDHRDLWGAGYFLAFVTLPGIGTRTLEAYPDWDDYKKWARASVDALVTEAGRAILRGGK